MIRETFYEPTDDDLDAYSKHCQKEKTMTTTPSKEQLKDEIILLLHDQSNLSTKVFDKLVNLIDTLYSRIPD